VPGRRVVFAVASSEDGSQPLTIPRCRSAVATRPAHRHVYHPQHSTRALPCPV